MRPPGVRPQWGCVADTSVAALTPAWYHVDVSGSPVESAPVRGTAVMGGDSYASAMRRAPSRASQARASEQLVHPRFRLAAWLLLFTTLAVAFGLVSASTPVPATPATVNGPWHASDTPWALDKPAAALPDDKPGGSVPRTGDALHRTAPPALTEVAELARRRLAASIDGA